VGKKGLSRLLGGKKELGEKKVKTSVTNGYAREKGKKDWVGGTRAKQGDNLIRTAETRPAKNLMPWECRVKGGRSIGRSCGRGPIKLRNARKEMGILILKFLRS